MFIKRIEFTEDIFFEVNRENHKRFKVINKKAINERKSTQYNWATHKKAYKKVYDHWQEFKLFSNKESYIFGKITSVIGSNGSGKTSLIRHLLDSLKKTTYLKIDFETHPEHILYFDATKNDPINTLKGEAALKNINTFVHFWDMQSFSHGERMIDEFSKIFLDDTIKTNTLLILDEPEQGLDWNNQQALMKNIKEISKLGSQVIIISHSPFMQLLSDTIIDMDKRKNINVSEQILSINKLISTLTTNN